MYAGAKSGHHPQHGPRGRQRTRVNQVILVALVTVTCIFFLSTCFLFSRSSSSLHSHEGSTQQLVHGVEDSAKVKNGLSAPQGSAQLKNVQLFLEEWRQTHKSEQELLEAFVAFSEAQEQREGSQAAMQALSPEKLAAITKLLGSKREENLPLILDATAEQPEAALVPPGESEEGVKDDKTAAPLPPDFAEAPAGAVEAQAVASEAVVDSVGVDEGEEGEADEQSVHDEEAAVIIDFASLPPAPPTLDFLATLLEQHRVESLLWDQHKERENFEGSKYHLEVLREKIAKYQALPEIYAYAKAVREATIQALRRRQSDCSRTLLCVLNKGCGFGCQLHHAVHCFTNAVATRRALVLDAHPWSYSEHYETYFHPVSSCPHDLVPKERQSRHLFAKENGDHNHVFLGIIDTESTGFEPPFLPPDVMALVRKFHSQPHVWWVGILSAYLMKLEDPSIITYPPAPYTALHVRRTDKVGTEADHHDLDEYMPYVKHKNVYLATDDPSVVQGAKDTYPEYEFYNNLAGAEVAKVSSRYTDASLEGLLQDVFVLAHADFLVGTFSSQVSRLGYEIAQTLQVDGIYKAHSIDSGYYFGGWQAFKQCLVEDYKGFAKGYAIRYGMKRCDRTGYFKDDGTQQQFPFHLTEHCSPYFANLLSDEEIVPPPPPPPPPPPVVEEAKKEEEGKKEGEGEAVVEEREEEGERKEDEKGAAVEGKKARVKVTKKGAKKGVTLGVKSRRKRRSSLHREQDADM